MSRRFMKQLCIIEQYMEQCMLWESKSKQGRVDMWMQDHAEIWVLQEGLL